MRTTTKTTYVIGDVQGCLTPLKALLEKIQFDPISMQLWFTGDLINRGPESLNTLRFIKGLPEDTVCVLGNHDLALLVADHGFIHPKPKDTYAEILAAPDKQELLDWLRQRPLLHYDQDKHFVLTHAGIYPYWDLTKAIELAHEVTMQLRSTAYVDLLKNMFGNDPLTWNDSLSGWDRTRFIINAFTRMRFCTPDGKLELDTKGTPTQHPNLLPWYAVPGRIPLKEGLIFGHWAALSGKCHVPNIYPIDTGCVWGHCLTAFCLESKQCITMDCA